MLSFYPSFNEGFIVTSFSWLGGWLDLWHAHRRFWHAHRRFCDMPIGGFVFPTIVPRRLTVRFPLLWCHWGYCPCVGCVLCTILPLLFPVLEMLGFLPLFDGIDFWLCWSMRLILSFVLPSIGILSYQLGRICLSIYLSIYYDICIETLFIIQTDGLKDHLALLIVS